MTALQTLIIMNILTGRLIFDQNNNSSIKTFLLRSLFTLIFGLFLAQFTDILIMLILSSVLIVMDIYWVKNNIKLRYAVYMLTLFLIVPGISN